MERIELSKPREKGELSLEETLWKRRSIRRFRKQPLTFEQFSQMLWACQGIIDYVTGKRVAPSAGATYPLEVFAVVGEKCVEKVEAGVYHYIPSDHAVEKILDGDVRRELAAAALHQEFIAEAPMSIVIAAEYERTTGWYGERGIRYVHFEVGHVGQNIHLQAVALGLGTVMIGAFHDDKVAFVLNLPKKLHPLYIAPVGVPA